MATKRKRKAIDKLQNRLLKAYELVLDGEVTLAEFVGNVEAIKFMANMDAWEATEDEGCGLPDAIVAALLGAEKGEGIDS